MTNKHRTFVVSSVLAISLVLVGIAYAASAGPKNGGVFENHGSGVTWTAPARAVVSDDLRATALLAVDDETVYLRATDFNFSIPATSTVTGIVVDVERSATAALSVTDNAIRIVKDGTIGTTDRSNSSAWPSSDAYQSYGGSSDLWGETWTPEDINSELFGVAISAKALLAAQAKIDHIRITVFYNN